jgi:hypothetical protein
LPPSFPFAADFLSREWPLLLESCSMPRDSAKISAMVGGIRNLESLISLAEAHGVVGHLAAALAGVPGLQSAGSFVDSLRARQRAHVLYSLGMTAELFRILDLLRKSNIECVAVKGPGLSQRAYGDPAARQYVDLDLLVRQRDIPRAAELLVAAGCDSRVSSEAIRAGKIPGEYHFRCQDSKIIIELHTERTLRYFPLPPPVEEYFRFKTSLSVDGMPVPVLSAEDEFILISVHGATHFWERLMWISDVAAMVYNQPELDWKTVQESSAEVGAERMVRVALLLAERFLHVPVPSQMKREVESDSGCARLVHEIETWLPYGGHAAPQLARRAVFRFAMRGRLFAGAAYLIRLSFSTTEEDWSADGAAPRSRAVEILSRPFRLARKYRNPSS